MNPSLRRRLREALRYTDIAQDHLTATVNLKLHTKPQATGLMWAATDLRAAHSELTFLLAGSQPPPGDAPTIPHAKRARRPR